MSADDEARQRRDSATYLRYLADVAPQSPVTLMSQEVAALRRAADLLDPQPTSLREQVAGVIHAHFGFTSESLSTYYPSADAVLAVAADWLAAQPLDSRVTDKSWSWARVQRDHYVRLLRGQS